MQNLVESWQAIRNGMGVCGVCSADVILIFYVFVQLSNVMQSAHHDICRVCLNPLLCSF